MAKTICNEGAPKPAPKRNPNGPPRRILGARIGITQDGSGVALGPLLQIIWPVAWLCIRSSLHAQVLRSKVGQGYERAYDWLVSLPGLHEHFIEWFVQLFVKLSVSLRTYLHAS